MLFLRTSPPSLLRPSGYFEGVHFLRVGFRIASIGLPFALMALMITFLDVGGIPRPVKLVGALARLGFFFLVPCSVVGGLGLIVGWAFSAMLALQADAYWTYVLTGLACWLLAAWAGIVGMRALGVFYYHDGSILRWHREKPWWDVTAEN